MKKMKKAVISILLVSVMVMATACGSTFDASGYVKSCLDLLTRCEYEEYMTFTERSEEQAIADYTNNIDTIIASFDALGISEELSANYRTFFEDLFKQTKYTVLEATEDENNNFTVEVEIEQITGVFNDIEDELNAEAAAYAEEIINSGYELPSDEELNEWVYTKLYEILNANMENLTYNEKQTITVHVELVDEIYTIPDEDYEVIDAALIDLGDIM